MAKKRRGDRGASDTEAVDAAMALQAIAPAAPNLELLGQYEAKLKRIKEHHYFADIVREEPLAIQSAGGKAITGSGSMAAFELASY